MGIASIQYFVCCAHNKSGLHAQTVAIYWMLLYVDWKTSHTYNFRYHFHAVAFFCIDIVCFGRVYRCNRMLYSMRRWSGGNSIDVGGGRGMKIGFRSSIETAATIVYYRYYINQFEHQIEIKRMRRISHRKQCAKQRGLNSEQQQQTKNCPSGIFDMCFIEKLWSNTAGIKKHSASLEVDGRRKASKPLNNALECRKMSETATV